MEKICVYTACFGNHDKPAEIEGLGPVEAHCFTDDPNFTSRTWIVHHRRPRFNQPRMDAKWYKMSACHLFPELDASIYLDSSIVVRRGDVLVSSLLSHINYASTAFFEHPEGPRTLEEEAEFSLTMGKYQGEPLREQVAHYRLVGLPQGERLLAGGCIVRSHEANVSWLEKAWFDECLHWSVQDQLSLPYVLWRLKADPEIIPGTIYDNALFYRNWSGPDR